MASNLLNIVRLLIADGQLTPSEAPSLGDYWPRYQALDAASPYALAVRGGAIADRLGWAFVAGYQAAGTALFGHDRASGLFSLCATESGGAHPAAIATRLESDATLTGDKRWATTATSGANTLYVLASEGADEAGRKRLRVAKVLADTPGVTVTPQPPTPFVPEVPHASVAFRAARSEPLPGDGWVRWVRPFRTVEDLHVQAAVLAYLYAVGTRASWPSETQTRLIHLVAAGEHLAQQDVNAPELHVALAGWLSAAKALSFELEPLWSQCPPAIATAWQRDRKLLAIAGKARSKRLSRAFERLADGAADPSRS